MKNSHNDEQDVTPKKGHPRFVFSVYLDEKSGEYIDWLAAHFDRSKSWVVRRALKRLYAQEYAEHQAASADIADESAEGAPE